MHPLLNGVNGDSSYRNGSHDPNRHRVYVLSAKDSAACLKMAKNLAIYLRRSNQEGHEPSPGDLAYTLLERRSHLPWVVAIRTSNLEELAERLEQPTVKPLNATKQPHLGFVFNGQGAQWDVNLSLRILCSAIRFIKRARFSRIMGQPGPCTVCEA